MNVYILFITAVFILGSDVPEKDTVAAKVFATMEQCEKAIPWVGAKDDTVLVLKKECREMEVKEGD